MSNALKHMNWDRLRVFHAVACSGSLSKAAHFLGISQSPLSRQISNLEADLSMELFIRHARGLTLTEHGEVLFTTVNKIIDQLSSTESLLNDMQQDPAGDLTVSLSVGLGSMWLAQHLTKFIETYPDIRVRLLLTEDEVNLSAREAHISIRFKRPTHGNLIQKHLVSVASHTFASKDYLDKYGYPQSVHDLDNHRLIAYDDETSSPFPNMNWLLSVGLEKNRPHRIAQLRVNSVPAMMKSVASGFGIASLPDFFAAMDPDIRIVLPDEKQAIGDLYLVYPQDLRQFQRIRVFIDYVTELAQDLPVKITN